MRRGYWSELGRANPTTSTPRGLRHRLLRESRKCARSGSRPATLVRAADRHRIAVRPWTFARFRAKLAPTDRLIKTPAWAERIALAPPWPSCRYEAMTGASKRDH